MQKRSPESTVTVPVPLHSELKRGTLMSIIRQSGIPRQIFGGAERPGRVSQARSYLLKYSVTSTV